LNEIVAKSKHMKVGADLNFYFFVLVTEDILQHA